MCGSLQISSLIMLLSLLLTGLAQAVCPFGDLTGDCEVNMPDLKLFAQEWLDPCCLTVVCKADLDNVNSVDMADFALLAKDWGAGRADLAVSEFMARNTSTLVIEVDGQEMYPDWIEIYNPTDRAANLNGWYLTDNDANLTKWRFPAVRLDPGEFLMVYASDKDRCDPANPLHTNFRLTGDGEYLALVAADGKTIAHEFAPQYPEQLRDVSYGLAQYATMLVPTGANASYHVPNVNDVGTDWTAPDFDDSQWDTACTGLGFGGGLPETGQDIGTPSIPGSYSLDSGVYTVEGDGEDIWGDTDDFYYVYSPLSGDGELIARVVSQAYTDVWAKAGVMIREQLTDTSKHAMMVVTPSKRVSFQWVGDTRNNSQNSATNFFPDLPYWVRIIREGNTFTGYYSPDGVDWTQQGSETIEMAEDVYIGLCVTSHSDGVPCTARFDNVTAGSDIVTNLEEQMLGTNASLWVRIEFDVEDPTAFNALRLRMKYEDGFVAYINGQEVASGNAPALVQWNSAALFNRPDELSSIFEQVNLMPFLNVLLPKPQKNVLAIHALNDSKDDDEFLVLPELVGASNQMIPQYFTTPTPGTYNVPGAMGIVSDVWFSHKRGFYDASFQLILSTEMDDAEIRYTLDGSRPTITHGLIYTTPVNIDHTTAVRAVAVKPGWMDSNVEAHTYIFLDDVIHQPANPPGFPTNWGHTGTGDFQMDPQVVNDPCYSGTIKDDLKSVPTLLLVMDLNDWFGSGGQGIYMQGELSERAVSAELILPDGNEGFQINCCVMIVGGTSPDRWKMDKLSMRLKFKYEYGPPKLRFPLFGEEGTDQFDTLVVDARMNNSWGYGGGVTVRGTRPWISGRSVYQRDVAQYTRDQFVADIQNAAGGYAAHGVHVHLYLNGLYWGLYCLHERPDEHFAAEYLGGDEPDYDVMKHNSDTVINGSGTNYNEMFTIANAGLDSLTHYELIQQYLLLPDFIDYMITNFYVGNTDWAHQNWYATRSKADPAARWRYHSWDAEHVLENLYEDVTGKDDSGGPSRLHQKLKDNPEYRLLFADRVHRHFFNDGLLTPDGAAALYTVRLNEVDRAVVAESARWGDNQIDKHAYIRYLRDPHWLQERNWLLSAYFPQRTGIVLDQLRDDGLYPDSVDAPVFYINDVYRHGGYISAGDQLSMTAVSGKIYYTIDGNDPRCPATQSGPGSSVTLVTEDAAKRVLIPTAPVTGPTGAVLREYWTGITGDAVSDLTSAPEFPYYPAGRDLLTSFEAPEDWADYYGTRVMGYLHPPTTGSYTFWIASDDASEVWLSTNDDPANKALIASVPGWTDPRQWNKYAQQQSVPVSLTGGQKYYIEALHKEGSGNDNLAVTWQGPGINYGNPIQGQYLSPAGYAWVTVDFDDSTWTSGAGGVGYEGSPGDPVNYVSFIGIDVEADMYGNTTTCYIRIPFTYNGDPTAFNVMTLSVRYDDAFVAYLNGAEVARRNFTQVPQWDSEASASHSDTAAVLFENIDISDRVSLLRQGDNVLAIHGLNRGITSSDFLISVELEARHVSVGDPSPSAIEYIGPVTLDKSTHVKARVLDGQWSALEEAIFGIAAVADSLRISEIMYHPRYTGDPADPNKEFIELKNTGPDALNLNLVRFANGIDFAFGDMELGPGEYVVVVNDRSAFEAEYGTGKNVAGQYSGRLANEGERITLEDAIGQTILDFEYKDGWYNHTDGGGFSVTIIDPAAAANTWGTKDSWRASAHRGGSPGTDDSGILPNPGAVVINEVMSHSHLNPDWIELHNATGGTINIGGWYLSDNDSDDPNLMKYRIADGTTIGPDGYKVFYEDQDFNNPGDPGCLVRFALSENGEAACLSSADSNGLTGYREKEDFGASETGVSFGRYYKSSTGNYNFVAMDHNTPGADNADPKVGPIVINEIMYNPVTGNQNEEYVELYNITGAAVTLYDYVEGAPWKFTDGIDYTFPAGTPVVIPADGYVLVVKNPTAFTSRYGTIPGVQVVGPYDGFLSNAGETLELGKPGDLDLQTGARYYIRVDRIKYSDGRHPEDCPGGVDLWPTEADGGGKSLTRKAPGDYGNDVANWQAANPSPGQ